MARRPLAADVGVFCATEASYSRGIALAAFARLREAGHRPAIVRFSAGLQRSLPPGGPKGYVGLCPLETAMALRSRGIPFVNVSQADARYGVFPSVLPDNRAAGRLAAQHLLERDYRTIVYVHRGESGYSRFRGEGARDAALRAKASFLEIHDAFSPDAWRDVPLPAGAIGADDTVARRALEMADRLGWQVPEQLAVVGITNDELESGTSFPPLSSVDLNPATIGDRAARLLLRLMAGRPAAPRGPILIPPAGVVVRASSDMLAETSPFIVEIVRYARDRLAEGLRVADLARQFHMSRRHLVRLFQRHSRRTPVAMLRHLAVLRAKHLLLEGRLTLGQVAAACGYDNPQHFAAMFRQLTGATPAAYRERGRHGGLLRPAMDRA